jgi:ADP-ribose pyrophosphatase YjhB (NUDIX family)
VDRGELPAEAAQRETLEEVGLTVQITELLGVFGTPGKPIIIVYLSEVVAGEAAALDESLAVAWYGPEEIPWDQLAFPSTQQSLRALALMRGWPAPPQEPDRG